MFIGLVTFLFALLSGTGEAAWWNYPGLELWKFINLFLFIALLVLFLRRPLGDALRTRREGIRAELVRAQEERNAALAKLEEVQTRLSRLDEELANVREQSQREAAEEHERIRRSAEEDGRKLREQAQREIESAGKVARQELRSYAAEQSVRLAEEMIRRDIRPEDDTRLVNLNVEGLGGVRH
ncbi:MAG TPA: ATP synthase F0 subunit B [Pyrinomonadaceae bacterium]|jgi:ATP synthase F0 subunit b